MREKKAVLLLTPPFVQLNAPYAAVPFLAGTLEHYDYRTIQRDLSLAVALRLFSSEGISRLFRIARSVRLPEEYRSIIENEKHYQQTIERIIAFLQGKNRTFGRAHRRPRVSPAGTTLQSP